MSWGAVARTVALLVLLVLAAMFLPSSPASAHTELVAGTPSAGTRVDRPFGQVTLRFEDDVLADGVDVVVRGPEGDVVRARPQVSGAVVTVPVAVTEAGRHTVAFRVTGADGHAVGGSYTFRVTASGVGAVPIVSRASAQRLPSTGVAETGRGPWLVAGSGLVMLAVVLVSAARSGVRRRSA